MCIEAGSRAETLAVLQGHPPGWLGQAGAGWLDGVLTHVKMEKKEKGDGGPGRVCPPRSAGCP